MFRYEITYKLRVDKYPHQDSYDYDSFGFFNFKYFPIKRFNNVNVNFLSNSI